MEGEWELIEWSYKKERIVWLGRLIGRWSMKPPMLNLSHFGSQKAYAKEKEMTTTQNQHPKTKNGTENECVLPSTI